LGQRGREWAMQNMNTETVAAGYERLYAQVIRERSGSGS